MNSSRTIRLTLLALTVLALPLASAATKGSWTGWITDDHCGAKGASADHKACAEKCLGKGAKLVFFNSEDKKLYSLDKQDVAKAHGEGPVAVAWSASAQRGLRTPAASRA